MWESESYKKFRTWFSITLVSCRLLHEKTFVTILYFGNKLILRKSRFCRKQHKLRGRPELSPLSQAYTEYAGGGGQWSLYAFFIMLIMTHFHIKNQHFQSTLFGGRESQKKSTVYAFDDVGNSGRPPYS